MKLGLPIPNCREGRDILPGNVSPQALVDLARECESRGFDFGWANDYITTPVSTARGFDQPPSWYESLLSLCAIAMKTERIKLGVAVIVRTEFARSGGEGTTAACWTTTTFLLHWNVSRNRSSSAVD